MVIIETLGCLKRGEHVVLHDLKNYKHVRTSLSYQQSTNLGISLINVPTVNPDTTSH